MHIITAQHTRAVQLVEILWLRVRRRVVIRRAVTLKGALVLQ